MSKERIEVNIHYGQEDFKKLFEELVRVAIINQEQIQESINELGNKVNTQVPFTNELR
jgi:hypothetical protein